MRVGFIGLGSQGTPIAERIANSGTVDTVVWARRAEALAPFRGGPAKIAASPAELGEGLDLLATCVFDAQGTREILFGPDGAARTMPSGAIVMCHSTVSPQEIADLAAEAETFGLRLLDAPVSGGAPKAAAGELVVMVGGDEATFDEAIPVIETYSNLALRLGPIGAGQQAKLLNNTMLAAHLAIAHDVFAVAAELGLDQAGLGQILRSGSGRSFGLEVYLGSGALEPMTRSPLRPTLTKDVGLLSGVIDTSIADGTDAGTVLLPPAKKLIADLDRIAQASTTA
jgi:3-hydroxyisobutyrate dehydrogenase